MRSLFARLQISLKAEKKVGASAKSVVGCVSALTS
jgi:hypothetical protein